MNAPGNLAARLRPRLFVLLPAGLAAFSTAWILLLQQGAGVGVDWDSAEYICVARNLLAGRGFLGCGGRDFVDWAPLYPALLAAASLAAGADPYKAAGPLNAVLFGALVFASGLWLSRVLESRLVAAWGCLAVALSIPLARISSFALSEPAFLLFATLALIHADRRLGGGGGRALAWAAAFSALAFATRYAGAFVVGAVVAAMALARDGGRSGGGKPVVRRAMAGAAGIAAYALASAAPIGAWTAWNDFRKETVNVDYPIEEAVRETARVVGGWATHEGGGGAFGAAVLLCLAAAVGFRGARALRRPPEPDARRILLFGGFALGYVAFYAWTTAAGHTWHGVQWRHVLPAWIPLLFAAALEADRVVAGRVGTARAASALAAALFLWLGWGAVALFVDAAREGGSRQDPVLSRAKDSDVFRYVRNNPTDGVVWGNEHQKVVVSQDGMTAYSQLPVLRLPRSGSVSHREALDRFFDRRGGAEDYVIWLYESASDGVLGYGADDVYALPRAHFQLAAALADGLVFRAAPAGSGPRLSLTDAVLRRASRAVLPSAIAAGSIFEIYAGEDGKHLIYLRRECRGQDANARFFLHVRPVRVTDLADDRRVRGFDTFDFDFGQTGIRADGACLAFARLPEYGIARVTTGQYASGKVLWKAEFSMPARAERQAAGSAKAASDPG